MYGIGGDYKDVTNSFNAGTITYDASAITTPMSTNTIYFGEITGTYRSGSSGNKFKNQNGFALGCYGVDSSCTLEQSQAVGTYTRDDAPDILSIINGDDAFEILEGEELPTLKAFNQ
jgi:hypothetical protein